MARTIVFGDIHGCLEEWQALIKKLAVKSDDRLISVGDIICKGPFSKEALDLAMSMPNLTCIIGNHEYYVLKKWQNKELHELKKDYHLAFLDELGHKMNTYMEFMATWPYYVDTLEFTVVHAGIVPGVPLAKQNVEDLVYLRTLPDSGDAWYDDYHEDKLIVHGHWARRGLQIRDNVIGLDTGCVYGKELSAVILPERKIVSVKAKKAYAPVS